MNYSSRLLLSAGREQHASTGLSLSHICLTQMKRIAVWRCFLLPFGYTDNLSDYCSLGVKLDELYLVLSNFIIGDLITFCSYQANYTVKGHKSSKQKAHVSLYPRTLLLLLIFLWEHSGCGTAWRPQQTAFRSAPLHRALLQVHPAPCEPVVAASKHNG